jgi:hypothetical protein
LAVPDNPDWLLLSFSIAKKQEVSLNKKGTLKREKGSTMAVGSGVDRRHLALYDSREVYRYAATTRLHLLMKHRIPKVVAHLEEHSATWHPSGFMVFRLPDEEAAVLGTCRLHVWPAGLRRREFRGYGGLVGQPIWDADGHDHDWIVTSHNIKGYRDVMFDVTPLERYSAAGPILEEGVFRRYVATYLENGEDALVASGDFVRARPRETRCILDGTIHEIERGDYHAPCIPRDELGATLVYNSHRMTGEGPNVLVRGTAQPIVGARRAVTCAEKLEARRQLLEVL